MAKTLVYTPKQFKFAVNLAAFLGWLMIAAPVIFSQFNPMLWIVVAGIGVPIALLISWCVLAPILRKIMQHPISWARAATWGALVSMFMSAIAIAVGRYSGWRQSVNPNSYSRIGGDGSVRSIDGILTPYGWLVLAQSTALFVIGCVVIALILRAVLGPGQVPKERERFLEEHL